MQQYESPVTFEMPAPPAKWKFYTVVTAWALFFACYCGYAYSIFPNVNFSLTDPATAKSPVGSSAAAQVNQIQGIYIFTDSKPVAYYNYLGTVTYKGTFSLNPQYSNVRDALVKKVREQYPAANGIIFNFNAGGADKADAIVLQP